MNRTFDHFPQDGKSICPICGTTDDKPCFLVPVDGTEVDGNCEAQPVHAACVQDNLDQLKLNRESGIIYIGLWA